jgi:hypothetical protein
VSGGYNEAATEVMLLPVDFEANDEAVLTTR